ncbi:GGDEF domain-containing protein [Actinocrinis puniceicyclus]|uniref:GGDEF domain-containing protein n=1 Tax=Actinocrinis puniceicyclus TaxID=977794 RepID=A0A8J8BCH9_9ACTN|nr:sensor domain-containing diguanylate cyclase [Actinocrinis puniceicyclus]MBS2961794.1 GGDEF domain-containing protein [Actinocrinis puniceicyclus]
MAAIQNRRAGRAHRWPKGRNALPSAVLTAVAVLACGYTAGCGVHWGSPPSPGERSTHTCADLTAQFGPSAAAALAAVSCAGRAVTARGRKRASWSLFAASALVSGLGSGVCGWYEVASRPPPSSPSPADWLLPCFAPFAITGALVHQRGSQRRIGRLKLLLDGVMLVAALFVGGWTVALAQDAGSGSGSGSGSDLAVANCLAYPVSALLLVGLMLALRVQGGRGGGPSMATMVAGYAVIAVSDAIWTVPPVRAGQGTGRLSDSGWFLGHLLLAAAPWLNRRLRVPERILAGQRVRAALVPRVRRVRRVLRVLGSLGLLAPYLAGLICLAGIMADALIADHRERPALPAAGVTGLAALVARQAVTLRDDRRLTRELTAREDHFRSLVQGSGDVIMTLDPGGRVGYVSPASLHMFGYEPEALADTSLYRLVHPDDEQAVARAVRGFLAGSAVSAAVEWRIRAAASRPAGGPAGSWRHAECTLTRHRGGLVLTCRDVSDRVALQRQLAYNAYHDALTGLPNRALFADRLEQALAQKSASARPIAVLFLDLDRFKQVNDVGGHAAGDALLTEAAARLRGSVRAGDTVARFGGDEFAALVKCDPDGRAARDVAGRLCEALTQPYALFGARFVIGASIGVAFWRPGVTAAELMREADLAMYQAKAAGKGRVVICRPEAPKPEAPCAVPAGPGIAALRRSAVPADAESADAVPADAVLDGRARARGANIL